MDERVDHERLVRAATEAVGAGGDGFRHTVGAAVLDRSGRIHVGVNVYHFTGGPCAELVAIGVARAAGATELASVVAVGDEGRGVIPPCGRCRQVLADLHPSIRVLLAGPDGPTSVPVADLLPHGACGSIAKPP